MKEIICEIGKIKNVLNVLAVTLKMIARIATIFSMALKYRIFRISQENRFFFHLTSIFTLLFLVKKIQSGELETPKIEKPIT